jgi:hypothetical protein
LSAGYIYLPAEEVSVSSPCGLLIGIYTFYGNGSTGNFRKLSFFPKIQPIQKSNLTLTPTYLQFAADQDLKDYTLKEAIRV